MWAEEKEESKDESCTFCHSENIESKGKPEERNQKGNGHQVKEQWWNGWMAGQGQIRNKKNKIVRNTMQIRIRPIIGRQQNRKSRKKREKRWKAPLLLPEQPEGVLTTTADRNGMPRATFRSDDGAWYAHLILGDTELSL
mgnify:CR=1 FL=1